MSVKSVDYNGFTIEIRRDLCPFDPQDLGLNTGKVIVVNYHKDLWIEKPDIITEQELKEWYRYAEPIEQEQDYYIFELKALIHGASRHLSLTGFSCDPGGWDTSRVGAVLVSKDVESRKVARKRARQDLKRWSNYLMGQIYLYEIKGYEMVGGFTDVDYAIKKAKENADAIKERERKLFEQKRKQQIKQGCPLNKRQAFAV